MALNKDARVLVKSIDDAGKYNVVDATIKQAIGNNLMVEGFGTFDRKTLIKRDWDGLIPNSRPVLIVPADEAEATSAKLAHGTEAIDAETAATYYRVKWLLSLTPEQMLEAVKEKIVAAPASRKIGSL